MSDLIQNARRQGRIIDRLRLEARSHPNPKEWLENQIKELKGSMTGRKKSCRVKSRRKKSRRVKTRRKKSRRVKSRRKKSRRTKSRRKK